MRAMGYQAAYCELKGATGYFVDSLNSRNRLRGLGVAEGVYALVDSSATLHPSVGDSVRFAFKQRLTHSNGMAAAMPTEAYAEPGDFLRRILGSGRFLGSGCG